MAVKNNTVSFSGGVEVSDYCDIIGPTENKMTAWQEILDYLKSKGFTRLELDNIPETSASLNYFRTRYAALISKEDTTPLVSLPASNEEFITQLPRKSRHELRRKIRKFERDHPEIIISEKNPDQSINDLLQLMRLDPGKNEFLTPDMEAFFRLLFKNLSDRTIFLTLSVKSEVTAVTVGFNNNDSFYLYNSGFNETDFSGSGYYLKAKSIETAISKGLKTFNFLQGNERYKYELGGKDFYVYNVKLTL